MRASESGNEQQGGLRRTPLEVQTALLWSLVSLRFEVVVRNGPVMDLLRAIAPLQNYGLSLSGIIYI